MLARMMIMSGVMVSKQTQVQNGQDGIRALMQIGKSTLSNTTLLPL